MTWDSEEHLLKILPHLKTSVSPEIIIQSVVGSLFFTVIAFKYASSTTFFVIGKFTSRQFSLILGEVISKFCKPIWSNKCYLCSEEEANIIFLNNCNIYLCLNVILPFVKS